MWTLDLTLCVLALGVALWFRPWQMLRDKDLHHPWLAMLVLLPWLWSVQSLLPIGLPLQLSAACLLVLMFGWPLAVLTVLIVAPIGAWLGGSPPDQAVTLAAWNGVVPATLALALGMAVRRWLPHHIFVFILGRGFIVTALSMSLAGWGTTWLHTLPVGTDTLTLMMGHWLMGWGEAFSTGMLTAIFVAFRPQWLVTWSDARYLGP
jgi:uncharacterized membrane protein